MIGEYSRKRFPEQSIKLQTFAKKKEEEKTHQKHKVVVEYFYITNKLKEISICSWRSHEQKKG